MKKLIYLCFMGLIPSGLVLAQDSAFFDPVQSKAGNCQYLEQVKEVLSCEQRGDTNCASPNEGYGIPPLSGIIFQSATTFMCSFQCVVGQERCNETLNPDGEGHFFGVAVKHYEDLDGARPKSPECHEKEQEGVITVRTDYRETIDDDGYRNIEHLATYTYRDEEENISECSEWVEYVEICDENDETNCTRIDKYSEEWYAHKKQIQRKKYKESCFIPMEEDCSRITEERQQCMLDVAEFLNTVFCSSMDPIWLYRDWKEHMTKMKEMSEDKKDQPYEATVEDAEPTEMEE